MPTIKPINLVSSVQVGVHLYDESTIIKAFNLWMDDFLNNPQKFEEINASAHRHLEEKLNGEIPSYGDDVTATLFAYCKVVDEQKALDSIEAVTKKIQEQYEEAVKKVDINVSFSSDKDLAEKNVKSLNSLMEQAVKSFQTYLSNHEVTR